MTENIILLLDTDFKTSTPLIDIAKGKYKLPETKKDLLNALKLTKDKWKK